MNIFRQFFAYLRLREAIRKADEAYIRTKNRQYVLPGSDCRLIIMDRSNFRLLKRKGYIPNNACTHDAVVESFYFTPYRDGSGWITKADRLHKLKKYFQWYAKSLKEIKKKKEEQKQKSKFLKKKMKEDKAKKRWEDIMSATNKA